MRRKSSFVVELLTVLTEYIETHKRLVVPQLGAFLVKEAGKSVVFSELMKRDDGVLRGLLCDGGLSEVEAAGAIDRFVFGVRHAVENGTDYRLAGFGTMKSGPNGTIVFVYRPEPEVLRNPDEKAVPHPQMPEVPKPIANTEPAPNPVPAASSSLVESDAKPSVSEPAPKPVRHAAPRPVVNPFPQPQPARVATSDSPHRSHIDTVRMAESVRTAFGSEPVEEDAPTPKGSTPAKRYDTSYDELEEDYVENASERRKVDRFLLFAILAALVAVAAIAFGFWREARERQAEDAMFRIEDSFDDDRFEYNE